MKRRWRLGVRIHIFVTPNGLDGTDAGGEHHATAADLALIMRYCVALSPKKEEFLQVTQTQSYSFGIVRIRSIIIVIIIMPFVDDGRGFEWKDGFYIKRQVIVMWER